MPIFGRGMLEHWALDPGITYLNHGTVGAPPRRVLQAQQRLRDEMERQPARFVLRELGCEQPAPWRQESRLREAIGEIAPFFGSRPSDLAFVPNVTTGLNAVLCSVPFGHGDEILLTDLGYGSVTLAAGVIARERGAAVRTVEMPYPLRDGGQVVDAILQAITPRTRLVIADHITARTALVLPIAAIVAGCHDRGVPVLVDGAHAPGSIALDIPAVGADWYAANLHKWAHAPRACGIIWAQPERQATLRAPVVSWGSGKGFHAEFDHYATNDSTSYLAAPEGLRLLREWDFDAVLRYMHGLAREAARVLTAQWDTAIDTPDNMIGAMITVPLPAAAGTTMAEAEALRTALLVEDQIEVQMHAWKGRVWARISAQVYNDRSDIERLAAAVLARQGRGR